MATRVPLSAIQESFDQDEGKQEEESLVEAKPMGNSARLVDAIEVEIEGESLLNGKYKIHHIKFT